MIYQKIQHKYFLYSKHLKENFAYPNNYLQYLTIYQ